MAAENQGEIPRRAFSHAASAFHFRPRTEATYATRGMVASHLAPLLDGGMRGGHLAGLAGNSLNTRVRSLIVSAIQVEMNSLKF